MWEAHRREDRGAEGMGCGERGCPHPHCDRGLGGGRAVPPPQKKIDFGSQIGEFWCKLGAFCTDHLKLV